MMATIAEQMVAAKGRVQFNKVEAVHPLQKQLAKHKCVLSVPNHKAITDYLKRGLWSQLWRDGKNYLDQCKMGQ